MSTLLEQATPRPWHTCDRGIGFEVHSGNPADGCLSDEPKWCLSVNDGFRETMSQADAELIVRAVNAYEPLVKALRKLVDVCRDQVLLQDLGLDTIEAVQRAIRVASAALATVESPAEAAPGGVAAEGWRKLHHGIAALATATESDQSTSSPEKERGE